MELTGIIVGCTKSKKNIGGLKYTHFSVSSEKDGKIKEIIIHGLHENLLPKRKIKILYQESTLGKLFADNYSLLDDKGKEIYTRSFD